MEHSWHWWMGTWKLETTVDEARPGVAGLDIFLI
jgi:hypothetical protein